ncbi:hypothetical protein ACHAXA_003245 [Cyclostephanos tholiformis]|jgi:hypothetical protein|uniref:Uncharacterized protein n=1 Tax=Cyclostephanos tholiformis TaxID=382380 RepID=A0ABD3SB00_9STRA
MHFQIAASILTGCVAVNAVADARAATDVSNAASISSSSVTLSHEMNNRPRRLLQRLKKRRDAATFTHRNQNQSEEGSDVGILAKSAPRFLQDTDYEYYCPRDTCPTELCDCADSGGSLEDCTSELQSVCRDGKLGDCVYAAYVKVYEDVYCPFVSCVDQGFREDQCDCAFYELYCSRLKSEECSEILNFSTDDADKKPFFGCDETSVAAVCDTATACKNKGDLQGLDIGTWQGAVATGMMKNAGDKFGGRDALMGLSLLSVIWLLVNTSTL